MNNITDPDILDKIRLVEGEAWNNDCDINTNTPALQAFLNWSMTKRNDIAEDPEYFKDFDSNTWTGIVLYGTAGWNRYFIRGTGEVVFSRRHASTPEKIKKALEAGFTIQD